MTIKRFIEAAIEGGWDSRETLEFGVATLEAKLQTFGSLTRQENAAVLLDPLAWQAVGIPNGMIDMAIALCDGRTIEEYLATL